MGFEIQKAQWAQKLAIGSIPFRTTPNLCPPPFTNYPEKIKSSKYKEKLKNKQGQVTL